MSDIVLPDLELAPEPPPTGARVWLRANMFSTPVSGLLSIIALTIVFFAVRGLLSFVFNPSRRWDAVTFNMKLLMVQGYPGSDLWRVWMCVGAVVVMLAMTFAVWNIGGKMEPRQLGKIVMSIGAAILIVALLGPFSTKAKIIDILVAVVLLGGGYFLRKGLGPRAKKPVIPVMAVVGVGILILIAIIQTLYVPFPARDEAGTQIIIEQKVADSTIWPWTIILLSGIVAYLIVRPLVVRGKVGFLKPVLTTLWLLSFPVIYLLILRDPDIDWNQKFGVGDNGELLSLQWWLIVLVFIVVGWFLLKFLSRPSTGELGRIIAGVLLLVALMSFAFPMAFIYRFLLLALALFALAAPTFGGRGTTGRRFLIAWAITAFGIGFVVVAVDTRSLVDAPGSFFLGGLALTILLAFSSIVLSFPLGVLLALGRTSTMPLFRLMSTAYIELVRGVPLITWLLVAFLMLPVALPRGVEIGNVMRAIGAMTFFSAAYLAENVRGGLQSIPNGQNEASKALGMSTLQMTLFITLPQALRAVIPALVGQVIALFKDTSLVTIVGLFDFLHLARLVIPSQTQPFSMLGSIKETLIFAAVVYWMFTFTFSRISLRLEKKLGVGER